MLLSMTGHGEARLQQDGLTVAIELRTINSRFMKVVTRCPDRYSSLEPQIEATLRAKLRRGTIQATLRVHSVRPCSDYEVSVGVLDAYRRQLEELRRQWNLPGDVSLESLLPLPGVVDAEGGALVDVEADWPLIAQALDAALKNLDQMRIEEGRAMAADMTANCQAITRCLAGIKQQAPAAIESYRARLVDRVNRALAEYQVSLEPADLVREVVLYAERSDISEEIVRLASHLDQFAAIMGLPESSGRKLEFVIQEMFRETNTIGSKSSDVELARLVIEIKTAIERLREMVQNVE